MKNPLNTAKFSFKDGSFVAWTYIGMQNRLYKEEKSIFLQRRCFPFRPDNTGHRTRRLDRSDHHETTGHPPRHPGAPLAP